MENNYSIKISNEIPEITYSIYDNNNLVSEVVVDIYRNYSSIPVNVITEFSAALSSQFSSICQEMAGQEDIFYSYSYRMPVLANIATMKRQVEQYLKSLENS